MESFTKAVPLGTAVNDKQKRAQTAFTRKGFKTQSQAFVAGV